MADEPFINGCTFKVGDSGDPTEVFTAIPKVISYGGLGKTNPLKRVTNFDSSGEEYIAGLADGKEITVSCIYMPGNTVQEGLIADVDNGTNRNHQTVITDGTDTVTIDYTFTPIGWELGPSFEDKNTIDFQFKISGAITRTAS